MAEHVWDGASVRELYLCIWVYDFNASQIQLHAAL